MRPLITTLIAAFICAAGLALALLSFPGAASAWGITNLPPGWAIIEHDTGGLDPNCQDAYRIQTDTHVVSGLFCTGSPTYQQDFDAWVDAHYTPPVTTTTTTVATTDTTTTTTAATTTTAPVDTVSTTTAATPAVTTTVTITVTDPTIDQRITALEANYAALAARVDAIAKANTASWDAFLSATNSGASVADAALAARSAGLNAIYGL